MAEWWSAELLDRRDQRIQTLPRVSAGKLSWSIFKAVPGSGSIELTRHPDVAIDWRRGDRIAVWHHSDETITPFGVFLPMVSGWEHDGPVSHASIMLADKCEALNSEIGAWLTYEAGVVVTDTVAAIIRDRGETNLAVTPSTETLRTALSWEPNATWLQVVNDLLAAINYTSLWVDNTGAFRLQPYLAPADRPAGPTYGKRAQGHLPLRKQFSDDMPTYGLPTGFRVIVPGNDTTPGLIGKADLPPEHPLSAQSRGITDWLRTENADAATSQEVADQIAARRLQEALQVTRRATITHPVDGTQMNDVVTHGPLAITGPIVQRDITLGDGSAGAGAVVTDAIRLIYTGGDLP
ncbi:hypothetical protein H5399_05020 [Tessaracoccus sp. MC1627]|uniref:hypothetical protein n=1 Tax=Tessaracoccus sp. MC1627 TaxID=2760312 RepID=UPI0016048D46|nr:hypothetical protein [Tessaracoccus sp. MC1627]MBB1511965.1 hypothetical protein [Tessaracoccus sp. MC1627]